MNVDTMSRARAHEILDLWRAGIEFFPVRIINMALYVLGDLESAH